MCGVCLSRCWRELCGAPAPLPGPDTDPRSERGGGGREVSLPGPLLLSCWVKHAGCLCRVGVAVGPRCFSSLRAAACPAVLGGRFSTDVCTRPVTSWSPAGEGPAQVVLGTGG